MYGFFVYWALLGSDQATPNQWVLGLAGPNYEVNQIRLGEAKAIDVLIVGTRSQNPIIRERSLNTLGRIGDDRAGKATVDCLKDINARVRYEALGALREMDYKAAVPLMLPLMMDSDQNVSSAAYLGVYKLKGHEHGFWNPLYQNKNPRMRAAVLRCTPSWAMAQQLSRDPDVRVRAEALEILSRDMLSDRARVLAGSKDKSAEVRAAVARGLFFNQREPQEFLLGTLASDPSRSVRLAALRSLTLDDNLADYLPAQVERQVIACMSERDPRVREAAARVVGTHYFKNVEVERDRLLDDTDKGVRLAAMEALFRQGRSLPGRIIGGKVMPDGRGVDAIQILRTTPDANLRLKAVNTIRVMGSNAAREALRFALNGDSSPLVRQRCAVVLGNTKDLKAIQDLSLALSRSDRDTAYLAAASLGRISEPEALNCLLQATRLPEGFRRACALAQFIHFNDPKCSARALELLSDPSDEVRLSAIRFFRFNAKDVRQILEQIAVNDWSKKVRESAVEALRPPPRR